LANFHFCLLPSFCQPLILSADMIFEAWRSIQAKMHTASTATLRKICYSVPECDFMWKHKGHCVSCYMKHEHSCYRTMWFNVWCDHSLSCLSALLYCSRLISAHYSTWYGRIPFWIIIIIIIEQVC
jgi:hypothetical protein